MKYIDADLLRKDIDEWEDAMTDCVGEYSDGVKFALEHFTFLLDSLQQEQQEEPDKSLEEEIETVWGEYEYYNEDYDKVAELNWSEFNKVIKHFYDLGQSQMPMPEDTVLFQKGVAEGRRLEREDMMKVKVKSDCT